MKKFLILSEKSWHKPLFNSLKERFEDQEWSLIEKKEDLTKEKLERIEPEKIFIPHWSHIIPLKIFENFECVVFHMTDLPFGRGGSPLQNLISRGFHKTKISAIKVQKGLDTGPVYLKKDLDLCGTAKEIFLRSTRIIEDMIVEILVKDLKPVQQEGKIVQFTRRKPSQGSLSEIKKIEELFDLIRMLDCEDYPSAFLETENFKFEFTRASQKSDKEILADARIIKK